MPPRRVGLEPWTLSTNAGPWPKPCLRRNLNQARESKAGYPVLNLDFSILTWLGLGSLSWIIGSYPGDQKLQTDISFSFIATTHPQNLRQETSGRQRGP